MRVVAQDRAHHSRGAQPLRRQEVLLPMVHPAQLWQESGRWQVYGPQLLRFQDRKGFDFALSPTAEEAICALVRDDVKSYRQPAIKLVSDPGQVPRRDAPAGRPVARARVHHEGRLLLPRHVEDAHREYQNMFDAYSRIFRRCGLDFRAVEADTGAIGGSLSHEFQVLAATGEDSHRLLRQLQLRRQRREGRAPARGSPGGGRRFAGGRAQPRSTRPGQGAWRTWQRSSR